MEVAVEASSSSSFAIRDLGENKGSSKAFDNIPFGFFRRIFKIKTLVKRQGYSGGEIHHERLGGL